MDIEKIMAPIRVALADFDRRIEEVAARQQQLADEKAALRVERDDFRRSLWEHLGLASKTKPYGSKNIAAERAEEIRYAEGSYKEIAERFGVSIATVHYHKNKRKKET